MPIRQLFSYFESPDGFSTLKKKVGKGVERDDYELSLGP